MRTHIIGLAGLVAVATVVGGTMTATAAPPSGLHCPDHDSADVTKVELSGEVTHLDLDEGTIVCVKAGTENTGSVVVEGSGGYTSPITNRNGNVRGISYYVVYGYEPPCDPDDYTSECYEEPSS